MNRIAKLALLAVCGLMITSADGAWAKAKKAAATQNEDADSSDTAQLPHAGEKPLMVVRFNEDKVPYEWPLYNTLTKALEVKPKAEFDVVSVAPRTRDLNQQLKNNDQASADLSKVLATMKEIGMPENRYTVSKIYDDVKTSEVRIYIR